MARPLAQPHTLERRSAMLAGAIQHRVTTMTNAITPPGSRPPFTRQKTPKEIFQWWMVHWNDPMGQAERAKMTPIQQQQLYSWLMAVVNHPSMAGEGGQAKLQPVEEPQPATVLRPAQQAERRMEGPPVGSEVA